MEDELRETRATHHQYDEQLKKLNDDLDRQSSAEEQVRVRSGIVVRSPDNSSHRSDL